MDTDKCRTCLSSRKKLRSIFETTKCSDRLQYSEMITTIANVRISADDGHPKQICVPCCRKVRECYDFKLLIEKTNATFMDQSVTRINFSNIKDIKIDIDLVKVEVDDFKHKSQDLNFNFNGDENIMYNNTTIKKLNNSYVKDEDKKPITILEFLNTFKAEDDMEIYDDVGNDMDNYGPDSNEDDEEYSPAQKNCKITYTKKRKHEKNANGEDDEDYIPGKNINNKKLKKLKTESKKEIKKVFIKPVFINDLKLVPTPMVREKKNTKPVKQKKREIMCPYCGILTSSQYHLLMHTSEKSFKCDQCGKGYYTKKGLITHMQKHTGTKDFKCDQCSAAFYEKGSLKSHLISHAGVRKHVCEICKKGFPRATSLKRHQERHNSANKKVKCELCTMSFFCNASLRHHMRIHTGERPFNCEICSQPYSYKHDFNRHCYKVHGVFLKRRKVYTMNDEVLAREKALMQEVMMRAQGVLKEGDPINPIESEGAQAHQAFKLALEHLQSDRSVFPFSTGLKKRKTSH